MASEFSHLPKQRSELSNKDWACTVRDLLGDLNDLLAEAPSRDVTVQIEQRAHSVHEHPILSVKHLAENL